MKKYTPYIIGSIILIALYLFLTRTQQGATIVNKTGELFPQIAPLLPVYNGGSVVINLEQPKSSIFSLPSIPGSNGNSRKTSDCSLCIGSNTDYLLPAGELAKIGGLSGIAIVNATNWFAETGALYRDNPEAIAAVSTQQLPDIILVEEK